MDAKQETEFFENLLKAIDKLSWSMDNLADMLEEINTNVGTLIDLEMKKE